MKNNNKFVGFRRAYLLTFLLVTLSLSFTVNSYAVEGGSTTQDIAFVYYKMTGIDPDYDMWVDEYVKRHVHKYGELGKRDFLYQTRKELKGAFDSTDPENEVLTISKMATLEALMVDKKNPDKRFINIYFEESPPFIAKRIPDRNINIIVPNLEDKVKMVISSQDFQRMNELFYGGVKEKNQVMLKLYVKPISADADKPLKVGGKPFYLLLTELQDFEIYSDIGRDKLWPLPPPEPTPEELEAQRVKEMRDGFMNKYQ